MLIVWSVFILLILAMLAFDLFVVNRGDREIGSREALGWTGGVVFIALLFAPVVYVIYDRGVMHPPGMEAVLTGRQAMIQYLTGWLVEYALSVDNIFVFSVIFTYFQVPRKFQHRVLFWGVLGAILMRGAMIAIGAALILRFHWMIYVFGVLLILTAFKLLLSREEVNPEKNLFVRAAVRFLPFTRTYHGTRFFAREAGRLVATPLCIVLIVVETTDVLFAVDSIPAIFAITRDPFLVFSSNMLAILGLRSLYFALAAVIDKFRYLKLSLVFILMFIGTKMLLSGVSHIPTEISLGVVAGLLGLGVAASIAREHVEKRARIARTAPIEDLAQAAEYAWKRSRRIVIFVIGATVVLFGLIVGVLPGVPGIPIMIIGFMILATEFIWAKLLLGKLKRKALDLKAAAERFAGMTPAESEAPRTNSDGAGVDRAPAAASRAREP
jgi:tellurite resistance protein TerC